MEQSEAQQEFWTEERCWITEFVNDADHPHASLAACRVTPGTLTQNHSLSVTEWYIILQGQGRVFVGGTDGRTVGPGDTIRIPPGTSQQIRNTGHEDLIFHCLCQPRFTPDCYRNLEER